MCGIVAIASAVAPLDADRLLAARSALRHRGPDGAGHWLSADGRIGLAHARLAIVDPEGGAQPIASEGGAIRLVASGEICEHERLRRELEIRGHVFRTRSDSEVLLHLYEEYGDACASHVRGELAFVLWDERRGRLLAGRDRFGIRPLVWTEHGGAILLASEVKALFAAGAPRAWDAEALFVATSLQYTPPDRTLFAGIRTLPPGSVLVAERAAPREAWCVHVRRYWDLDYPREDELGPCDEAESVAEVRARLAEAVRLRALGGLPTAFQLSGGLDSTAVLALAIREGLSRPRAFTLVFDDPAYDERAVSRASARALGAELTEVDASQAALADALPSAVAQGEGLAINAHLPAKWLLARAVASAGFKVALSGEGADEVFAGYAHLRRDIDGVASLAATNAVSLGTMLPTPDPSGAPLASLALSAAVRALGRVPSFLEAKVGLGQRVRALLAPDFVGASRADPVAAMLDAFDVEAQLRGRAAVHVSLHLWTRLALATYILRTLGDGMDMAHALEVRLPYLDHHVFACARRLPVSMLVRGGVEKYALRRAVRDVVPEAVLAREKHPLLAPPLATAVSGRARELVMDVATSGRLPPFVDRAAWLAALARAPAMTPRERTLEEPALMMVLSACMLHTAFGLEWR